MQTTKNYYGVFSNYIYIIYYSQTNTIKDAILLKYFFYFIFAHSATVVMAHTEVRWEVDCLFVAKLGPLRDKVASSCCT